MPPISSAKSEAKAKTPTAKTTTKRRAQESLKGKKTEKNGSKKLKALASPVTLAGFFANLEKRVESDKVNTERGDEREGGRGEEEVDSDEPNLIDDESRNLALPRRLFGAVDNDLESGLDSCQPLNRTNCGLGDELYDESGDNGGNAEIKEWGEFDEQMIMNGGWENDGYLNAVSPNKYVSEQSEHESPSAKCPICTKTIHGTQDDIQRHVNECLDGVTEDSIPPTEVIEKITVTSSDSKKAWASIFSSKPAQASPTKPVITFKGPQEPMSIRSQFVEEEKIKPFKGASSSAVKKGPRPCPWYKKMPGTSITVDAFCYGAIAGCTAYFLSHYHSDHYRGLSKKWSHGPIFMSDVTANLVQDIIKVDSQYIRRLPMNEPIQLDGLPISVVLVDANHCPGAVLFLFTVQQPCPPISTVPWPKNPIAPLPWRHLHCGDFRAHVSHLQQEHILSHQPFHSCYLDTTYLRPSHTFPSQDEVISKCEALCISIVKDGKEVQDVVGGNRVKHMMSWLGGAFSGKPKRTLVVVGTYLIGKERVFLRLAKALDSKIFADGSKRRILNLLEDEEISDRLTADPSAASVHVVRIGSLNAENLQAYLTKHNYFDAIVAFRPTGWTFRPTTTPNGSWDLSPQFTNKTVTLFGVPYSEHSSFEELEMFVKGVSAAVYIPTVNIWNAVRRDEMHGWINRWNLEMKNKIM